MARKRIEMPEKVNGGKNTTVMFEGGVIPANWNWWLWANRTYGLCGLRALPPDVPREDVSKTTVVHRRKDKRGRVKLVTEKERMGVFLTKDAHVVGGPYPTADAAIEVLNGVLAHSAPGE